MRDEPRVVLADVGLALDAALVGHGIELPDRDSKSTVAGLGWRGSSTVSPRPLMMYRKMLMPSGPAPGGRRLCLPAVPLGYRLSESQVRRVKRGASLRELDVSELQCAGATAPLPHTLAKAYEPPSSTVRLRVVRCHFICDLECQRHLVGSHDLEQSAYHCLVDHIRLAGPMAGRTDSVLARQKSPGFFQADEPVRGDAAAGDRCR